MGWSILSQDRDFRRGPWTCTHPFAKSDVCYSSHWYVFFASCFLALALLFMFGLPTHPTSLHHQSFLKPSHRKALSPWLSWEPPSPVWPFCTAQEEPPGSSCPSNREPHTHHTHASPCPTPMRCFCRWLAFPLICLCVGLGGLRRVKGAAVISLRGFHYHLLSELGQKWGPWPQRWTHSNWERTFLTQCFSVVCWLEFGS